MLTPDLRQLKQFYASPLGSAVAAIVSRAVVQRWPAAAGETILALGFGLPWLAPYLTAKNQIIAAMPGWMGAVFTPDIRTGKNIACMAHEADLPLAGMRVNRVLAVHVLEHADALNNTLEECWRVLVPGGRLLAIVPNRASLWARSSHTPLGYGRPFSAAQLRHLLEEHSFSVVSMHTSLVIPPLQREWLARAALKMERLIACLLPWFGGVWVVEAEKTVYAAVREPAVSTLKARRQWLGARSTGLAIAAGRAVRPDRAENTHRAAHPAPQNASENQ